MNDGRAPGSEKVHAASPPRCFAKGDSATKRRLSNPRSLRPMLHCWFCGGRVVSLTSDEYRCEAEGVRWDMTENLVLYERPEVGA